MSYGNKNLCWPGFANQDQSNNETCTRTSTASKIRLWDCALSICGIRLQTNCSSKERRLLFWPRFLVGRRARRSAWQSAMVTFGLKCNHKAISSSEINLHAHQIVHQDENALSSSRTN